ncbi:polynucleotide adenylyltransferase PcnB [Piscinibacter koreensis]|uniref:Poly(A) polymerase I n=1 Tax=Piscinibacter koreensis TaxID=2742824 RepID=A0A7Y6NQ23_9BURK|nr:polynucleotide adenylyltransferase PcnB [Schlegelella koreensis]NUZ07139.1 polynucleotide adenylyltransferase PcnB [Schlegelella koreensis]
MIKKFIEKLLGKSGSPGAAATKAGVRVEVPKAEHGIDPKLVDERAVKVVSTLVEGGYEAYIVGGAVRDLLLGLRPKDFDIATNATPEQVKGLFRRAFIIGRRFRIVHVVFGRGRQDRGLSEVIEVTTFRAAVDPAASEQAAGDEKSLKSEAGGKLAAASHVVDASGRVLRDNVWGTQVEDAARRDFTVNAMYYDPVREVVVDYHGGMDDVKKKLLRMIGDPATRYREDPVRIIRAVRFAAKLGFEIEEKTRAPIAELAALLDNVPPSRTFDEMIKLLQTGHALASIVELKKLGLHRGVFPVLDVAFDESQRHDGREQFVQLALADTDRRIAEGKPVAPSFMLACMLWHDVQAAWVALQAKGEPTFPALQQAIDSVFEARIGDISGRGKLAVDMREVWMMQPRFERRTPASTHSLVEQPRFRAGLDFLRLRSRCGEADPDLAAWWETFSLADSDERERMVDAVRDRRGPTRVKSARRTAAAAAPRAESSDSAAAEPAGDVGATEEPGADGEPAAEGAPARKRRRRRRKPAGESAEPGVAASDAPAP